MGWSVAQQRRLGREKELLDRYFRGRTTWIDPTGTTKVEVRMTTSNNNRYTLRVYIPEDCLNSCPVMVVCSPLGPLRLRNGYNLPNSTSYHCWGTHYSGFTQICHHHPECWTSQNTLYQVFMKGLMWLEAYEGHLRTGKPLDAYLAEMRYR